MPADHAVFRRPGEHIDIIIPLSMCERWGIRFWPWSGEPAPPDPLLYRTPSGEYFRPTRREDWSVATESNPDPKTWPPDARNRFRWVSREEADGFIKDRNTVKLTRTAAPFVRECGDDGLPILVTSTPKPTGGPRKRKRISKRDPFGHQKQDVRDLNEQAERLAAKLYVNANTKLRQAEVIEQVFQATRIRLTQSQVSKAFAAYYPDAAVRKRIKDNKRRPKTYTRSSRDHDRQDNGQVRECGGGRRVNRKPPRPEDDD